MDKSERLNETAFSARQGEQEVLWEECPETVCPEFPDDREAAWALGYTVGWWTAIMAVSSHP